MVDFITSFKKGLDAAIIASDNRKEIDLVFKELDEQIKTATNGKVNIYIKTSLGTVLSNMAKSISIGMGQGTQDYRPTPDKIVAKNPTIQNLNEKVLADIKISSSGYPCTITIAGYQHICEDKESLEQTLILLLEDPMIGAVLNDLVNLENRSESSSC